MSISMIFFYLCLIAATTILAFGSVLTIISGDLVDGILSLSVSFILATYIFIIHGILKKEGIGK
jgi:hypothetical protein